MRDPQALCREQLDLVAEPLAPMADVGALVRKLMLDDSVPVQYWK